MRIEIWSDIVSPFCFIGRRSFEAALARFAQREAVELVHRAFELDPDAPLQPDQTLPESLMAKTGQPMEKIEAALAGISARAAAVGLSFRLASALPVKTFELHRLIYLAAETNQQQQALERLQAAYCSEGENLGDPETLVRLLGEIGIGAERVREVLRGERYVHDVAADIHEALALGVHTLPYVQIDGVNALTGAQPEAACLAALERAWLSAQARPAKNERKSRLRSTVARKPSSPARRKKSTG